MFSKNIQFPLPVNNQVCNNSQFSENIIYVSFRLQDFNQSEITTQNQTSIINMIQPKTEYDGIFSLGAWCQVGGTLITRRMFLVHSPIYGFGIKTWENLITILQNRFEGYWELENMVIGKLTTALSHRYNKHSSIYKVYDNKYNMFSNHQFDEIDNSPTELKTYQKFKKSVNTQIQIFLKQNLNYERVLYVLKALSHPFSSTKITEQNIVELNEVLSELRDGRDFDLLFYVPEEDFEMVLNWVNKHDYYHFKIIQYKDLWAENPYHEDWNYGLDNVKLAENYIERLFEDIMELKGMPRWQQYQILNEVNGWA
ncbi:Conserved_hypothetical protein [Hexamita inflata]|uniref:Uncharacterized protein n=1 Tax=Hexamita inflata TaxID=28002 RepID=A0AA86V5D7_9EUKA|nr:Conserved hypothetical protein [Hexamita inflata]CAI9977081.1 Conserved hypothetical protein [Hexamita inflata]